jgi:hypothetical protein
VSHRGSGGAGPDAGTAVVLVLTIMLVCGRFGDGRVDRLISVAGVMRGMVVIPGPFFEQGFRMSRGDLRLSATV